MWNCRRLPLILRRMAFSVAVAYEDELQIDGWTFLCFVHEIHRSKAAACSFSITATFAPAPKAMLCNTPNSFACYLPCWIKLTKNDQINVRKLAYQALANMGSDESLRALAEAAVVEPVSMEKVNILFLLKELPNPVVIPYLKTMLKDDYVGGFTTTQRDGGKPVRYRVYMVRKWAYVVLKELGVDIPTVYEEEIK
jgi:HEAT repeat protein